jgi:cytochrome oxidase Cu insertion factor (SCO1/SenC/PrrC family)
VIAKPVFAVIVSLLLALVAAQPQLRLGDELPSTSFIDQSGRRFTFASLRGEYVFIAFIYTRCKDADECPLISSHMAQLQNRLDADTKLVEVTIDPAYDRPPVLAAYAKVYGFRSDRVSLLTGDPRTVLDFASALGVRTFTDPKNGFVHGENAVLVDPRGKVADIFEGSSWTTDEIVAVISHFHNRPPSLWEWLLKKFGRL